MTFANLQIQLDTAELLHRSLLNERLHHAYLFAGAAGVGKLDVAAAFARGAMCPDAPGEGCSECATCRRVAGFAHPDFGIWWLSGRLAPQYARLWPDEDAIWTLFDKRRKDKNLPNTKNELKKTQNFLIESVRDFQEAVGRPPSEARRKMFAVLEPERMTDEAANALLKTLEEPPPNTVLLLLSNDTRNIIPTILSRCITVNFPPLSEEHVAVQLAERYGVAPDEAAEAARHSRGSYITAVKAVSDEYRDALEAALKLTGKIASGANAAYLLAAAEAFKDKEAAVRLINALSEVYRDLAAQQAGDDDTIVNREVREITGELPLPPLDGIKAVASAITALRGNSHPRLTLEHLLLMLGGFSREPSGIV
ncbi:MAG: DNA polymerase III subunit [bacterium]|nr:DNA polymerase III subunit [bacterium]